MKKAKMLLAIGIAITTLTACGNSTAPAESNEAVPGQTTGQSSEAVASTENASTEGASTEGGKLNILAPQNSVNDGTNAMVAAFEEKYGIEVTLELLPDNEAENLIRSRAATGDLGDIVDFHSGSQLTNLSPEDNLMDITSESYLESIDEGFLNCVTINDKVYGTPIGPVFAGGVFYNKDIYKELGLEIPQTWDQFLDNCRKCEEAGYVGIIGTYGDAWTSQMVLLSDYYYVNTANPGFADDYTAGKVTLSDSPEYIRSIEKLASQKDYFNDDYLSATNDDGVRMLAEGAGAHQIMRTREYNALLESYPEAEDAVGMFAVPGDNPEDVGVTLWMPHGYYIAKNAENVEEAKLWQQFTTSTEGVEAYISAASPVGPFLLKGIDVGDSVKPAIADAMEYVNQGKSSPAMEFVCPVKGTNMAQICVQVGSGEISVTEGVEALHADNVKYAQQLGLDGWK